MRQPIYVSSFTYHSNEIENVSYYEPLATELSYTDSFTSSFSPLINSSQKEKHQQTRNKSNISKSKRSENDTSLPFNISNKTNLRIMTVNCRSIKDKTAEFKCTVAYTKPDIIIGTESWLKGIKPGENPMKDAIKSSEMSPENYTSYRNERDFRGRSIHPRTQ